MPSEMRYGEFKRMVEQAGWRLSRINGSHHIFKLPDGNSFAVPVHRNKVKPVYVREAKKIIQGS